MSAAVYDSSWKGSSKAGSITTFTSTNWTIANVANRCLYQGNGSGAGTPVASSGAKWQGSGGTALTQIGTTLTIGSFWRHTAWRLIAPTAATAASYATWGGSGADEALIEMIAFNNINQTTPNGTVAQATGNNLTATVNAVSVSGDVVCDIAFFGNDAGANPTITAAGSQVSRQEIEGATTGFEAMGCSTLAASGASTTMAWTASGSSADSHWGTYAWATNGIAAAGGIKIAVIDRQFRQRRS